LLHMPDLKGLPRSYVEQMIEAAMQARSVTRYLLCMNSKHELQVEPICVGELIEDLEQFLQMYVGPDIPLSVEVESDLGHIRGDAQKLSHVIIDLAANARDAMPRGGKLSIKAGLLELGYDPHYAHIRPGHYVAISISDTGHGMDHATQARIFDPFFTTKVEGKGAGLGLSYAQLIVEKQSGGKIQVSSQPDRGSTFTIYLPCAVNGAKESSRDVKGATSGSQHNTILVVTGDDVLRNVITELLGLHGYEVLHAKTASAALKVSANRRKPIHLLLADLVTLGRSGDELANDVISAHPQMKVIYMADHGELADSAGILAPDGAELLHKPFLSFELIGKIKRIVGAPSPN
jgi:two-component system, cell cycle sensor histidine kinase and response regulator CckA